MVSSKVLYTAIAIIIIVYVIWGFANRNMKRSKFIQDPNILSVVFSGDQSGSNTVKMKRKRC